MKSISKICGRCAVVHGGILRHAVVREKPWQGFYAAYALQ